jgi:hypothetical protein
LPTLNAGEPAFTTDTNEFFVGNGTSNIRYVRESEMIYETAGGTGTAMTLTLGTLTNGYSKRFIASANNSGSATTINGTYPLYKPNTTTAPNIVSGKAYTIWYNSTSSCFFCVASAEGDVVASQVLAGKTFSNDSDTGLTGSMANKSGLTIGSSAVDAFTVSAALCGGATSNTYVGAWDMYIPEGYYNGTSLSRIHIPNLYPGNIKAGAQAGWSGHYVTGTYTSDATATAPQILSGSTAYINGSKITGTMIQAGYANTPGSCGIWGNGDLAVYLAQSGYYVNGIGTGTSEVRVPVAQLQGAEPDLIASNIASGVTLFGIIGTNTGSTALVAGDNYLYVDNTVTAVGVVSYLTTPMLNRSVTCHNYGGTVRVRFSLYRNGTDSSCGRIYVNGVARGTIRTCASGTYVEYVEDITVNPNDVVQIYTWLLNGTNYGSCTAFKISCGNNNAYFW